MVFRGHAESFAARKEKHQLTDAVDLGLRIVPVSNIVGSVNRWQDFDAKFRIRNRTTYQRYQRIKQAVERGEILPPVQLYKVKETDETSATFSLVSLCHCIASNRLFGGRKLAAQEALTASSE